MKDKKIITILQTKNVLACTMSTIIGWAADMQNLNSIFPVLVDSNAPD